MPMFANILSLEYASAAGGSLRQSQVDWLANRLAVCLQSSRRVFGVPRLVEEGGANLKKCIRKKELKGRRSKS